MATLEDLHRTCALNQSLLRDVNERVVKMTARAEGVGARLVVLCECFDTECVETMSLTMEEYEAIRASPVRFPVRPGHVLSEVERVVERTDRYEVVEKFDKAGEVAAARDRRSQGG